MATANEMTRADVRAKQKPCGCDDCGALGFRVRTDPRPHRRGNHLCDGCWERAADELTAIDAALEAAGDGKDTWLTLPNV